MAGSQLAFPVINGTFVDFAKIALNVQTPIGFTPLLLPQIAFDAIGYKTDSDGEHVKGAVEMSIGLTTGQQTSTASCSMYVPAYNQLITALSNVTAAGLSVGAGGFMTTLFNLMVQYNNGIGGISTDMLFGCRIKSSNRDHKKGGAALTVSFDMDVVYIVENGNLPNDDALHIAEAYIALLTA